MLKQLTKEQVSKYWPHIKRSIEASSSEPGEEGLPYDIDKILDALMTGIMQAWVSYKQTPEGTRINGVGTTTFLYDHCSDMRTLLIYSAQSVEKTDAEDWISGYQTIIEFAKKNGCNRIAAYTKNKKILENGIKAGAEIFAYLSFPINSVQKLDEGDKK